MIKIATPEEAERAHFVICATAGSPTPFTDNEEAPCAHCGTTVIFRPHAPKTPPRICFDCALKMMEATRQ